MLYVESQLLIQEHVKKSEHDGICKEQLITKKN